MNDKKLCIETEGYLKLNDNIGYAAYEATPYSVLEKLVSCYPFQKEDCFVDFGCGLGRVICFVANSGCNNVIGIEVNTALFKLLRKNVKSSGLSKRISIYHQKAEKAFIPPEVNKCFFYNPFYLKYFIKVYNNLINYSNSETILLFLYDAAKEYIAFLESKVNVILEACIDCGTKCGNLYVYRVNNKNGITSHRNNSK